MTKIYNSSGIEVKMAILGPLVEGYICPSCGQNHCFRHHCLRCGQPLVYSAWQAENYVELFKDVDDECNKVDEAHSIDRSPVTNEELPTLREIRKKILGYNDV